MQGLVQAMQTQAHTQAALQAQLEAQAQIPAPVLQEHGHGGPSIMERFKRMAPPSFKGESDPLLTESWMMEIENIFRAISLPRLEGALNIKEGFPDSGVQPASTQKPDRGEIGGLLGLAEESFSGKLI
ncbi:hypothetical protein Taro_036120, partial [Colocasia esculenta]|nr:hypothetical protein [Colocasia esculenta]